MDGLLSMTDGKKAVRMSRGRSMCHSNLDKLCTWGQAMSRYWFHVRDEVGRVDDEEGADFPDRLSALKEALRGSRELLAEGAAPRGMRFEITDETGRVVAVLPIAGRASGQPVSPSSRDDPFSVEVVRTSASD